MVEFIWQVPENGFVWQLAHAVAGGRVQKEREAFLIPAFTLRWRSSKPLPALFRSFAEVKATRDGAVGFANQHGALSDGEQVIAEGVKAARGERLSAWIEEITHMRHAVGVWEALRAGRQLDLQRWFSLNDEGTFFNVRYTPDEPWPVGVGQHGIQFLNDELGSAVSWLGGRAGDPTHRMVPSSPPELALAWLRTVINSRLLEHASPRLLYVREDRGGVPLGVRIVPRTLLGAMWLQLARAIEGDLSYRQCEAPGCVAWIEIGSTADGHRADARYCSDKCRVNAFRKRKKPAAPKSSRAPRGSRRRQPGNEDDRVRAQQSEAKLNRRPRNGR